MTKDQCGHKDFLAFMLDNGYALAIVVDFDHVLLFVYVYFYDAHVGVANFIVGTVYFI